MGLNWYTGKSNTANYSEYWISTMTASVVWKVVQCVACYQPSCWQVSYCVIIVNFCVISYRFYLSHHWQHTFIRVQSWPFLFHLILSNEVLAQNLVLMCVEFPHVPLHGKNIYAALYKHSAASGSEPVSLGSSQTPIVGLQRLWSHLVMNSLVIFSQASKPFLSQIMRVNALHLLCLIELLGLIRQTRLSVCPSPFINRHFVGRPITFWSFLASMLLQL